MPYITSNTQVHIAPEDDAFLWQLEMGPQSWWTNEGSQNMPNTNGTLDTSNKTQTPLHEAHSRQGRGEVATLNSIRMNIRQLSEGFDGYILRSERRNLRALLEGTVRVDREAGGPVDIEATERDRLVEITTLLAPKAHQTKTERQAEAIKAWELAAKKGIACG